MRAWLISMFAALAVAACNQAEPISSADAQPLEAEPLENARLAAVLVHADWCASCRVLEPKLEELRARGPIDGVAHIALDYTDRREAVFYAAADVAGVGEAIRDEFRGEGPITGLVILVDVDDQKPVGALRKSMSVDELNEVIRRKLAEA